MTRFTAPPAALLFDIDGTLTDTDPLHVEAYRRVILPLGVTITHEYYLKHIMGFTNQEIMARLFPDLPVAEHERLAAEKEAMFRSMAAGGMMPTPGLVALMDRAEAAGIPMAAVTNAPRPNADLMLAGLGITHRFRAIVIGDELAHGKPHPLPYLTAASLLDVPAARCLAFEDSRSGLRSAVAAGTFAIGMASGLDEDALVAEGARFAVKDFRDPRVLALVPGR